MAILKIKNENGEFINIPSIIGKTGDKGTQGIQGIQGEQGIQGVQGEKGDKGDTGITPNIQIGTVTTLEAGSEATVTQTGTVENPIFNFSIPRGADGSSGSSSGEDVGKIVWTNPSPTSDFNSQTITLDGIKEDDYYYEIIYKISTDTSSAVGGTGKSIIGEKLRYLNFIGGNVCYRDVTASSTTNMTIASGIVAGGNSNMPNILVPQHIIVYKKPLSN